MSSDRAEHQAHRQFSDLRLRVLQRPRLKRRYSLRRGNRGRREDRHSSNRMRSTNDPISGFHGVTILSELFKTQPTVPAKYRWTSNLPPGGLPVGVSGGGPFRLANGMMEKCSIGWWPRDGDEEIFIMNADGTGVTQVTFNTGFADAVPVWIARPLHRSARRFGGS